VKDDNTGYDARAALEFFKSAGKLEKIAQGTKIFAEKDKPNRLLLKPGKMYLLLQGEVGLFAGKREIGAIRPGAVFGELAAITQAPRSAGAVAKGDCRLISLDEKQFQSALKKKPAFALMLMSVLLARLRATIAALGDALPDATTLKETAAFEPRHVAELVTGLSEDPVAYYDAAGPSCSPANRGCACTWSPRAACAS
jgi:CRP-like cAMP-binding protein